MVFIWNFVPEDSTVIGSKFHMEFMHINVMSSCNSSLPEVLFDLSLPFLTLFSK